MAVVDNLLLKGCRGKVDDLIFYQFRGRTCVRTKPDCGKITFSVGAIEQQERVAGVAALYQAAKAAGMLRIWQQAAANTRMSGYNLFMQRNVGAFTGEGWIGDFRKVALSMGTLPLPDRIRLVPGGTDEWMLEWQNVTIYPGANQTDRLVIALAGQENGFRVSIPVIGDYRREACRAVLSLPAIQEGYNHLYGWFSNAKGNRFSKSFYALLSN